MSEIPAPYGPKRKKPDLVRIADFMTGFLGVEMLQDIPCPENLQMNYDDMDDEQKKKWYEYTLNAVFKEAALQAAGLLGRQLKVVELNLIKRRIADFFIRNGMGSDNAK